VFRKLAAQKESRIEEGQLMCDHVHMMIPIQSKYAVSQVVGFIRGKSAIPLARTYGECRLNFVGQHFQARGHLPRIQGLFTYRACRNLNAIPIGLGPDTLNKEVDEGPYLRRKMPIREIHSIDMALQ